MTAGDKVSWESQALGSRVKKNGTVVAVVPKGWSAMQHIPPGAKKSHVRFSVDRAAIDRVLVAVAAGRNGDITHYYCPGRTVLVSQGNE